MECSGLEIETEVFEYQEGGLNDYVHRLPGRTKFSNITLKRGITTDKDLWQWYSRVMRGQVERKNVSVILYNSQGNPVMRWNFVDAYPIKWVGPAFKADANAIAIETLQFAHRGLNPTT